MKATLTKNEMKFIEQAANMITAVYDFENDMGSKFKEKYGLTQKQALDMAEKLQQKMSSNLKNK